MGTFLGLPMKILIFLSGIITTALCVTGLIIWWKKRVFRHDLVGRRRSVFTPRLP
jgi:uncharacterized iron-regulated membrane protein